MSTSLSEPRPGALAIASLNQAAKHKRRYDAIITLQDPRGPVQRLIFTRGPIPPRLILSFEDFDRDDLGVAVATADDAQQILDFGRLHAAGSMLVHCHHGIGRSAAAALAILADRLGPGREAQAVSDVFAMRPEACPNHVLVRLADTALGRSGALHESLLAHEAADPIHATRRANRMAYYDKNKDLFTHLRT